MQTFLRWMMAINIQDQKCKLLNVGLVTRTKKKGKYCIFFLSIPYCHYSNPCRFFV